MSTKGLSMRSFGDVLKPRMRKDAKIKVYNDDEKSFIEPGRIVDGQHQEHLYTILFESLIYKLDEDKLPTINKSWISETLGGKIPINSEILKAAQNTLVDDVSGYFACNLVPNIPNDVIDVVVSMVEELVAGDKSLGDKKIKSLKGKKTRNDTARFLAEVWLLAVCQSNVYGKNQREKNLKNIQNKNNTASTEAGVAVNLKLPDNVDVNELLAEVEYKCRVPECGVKLRYFEAGQTHKNYGIIKIAQNKAGTPKSSSHNSGNSDYFAVCAKHADSYNKSEAVDKHVELCNIKKQWALRREVRNRLDKLDIDAEVRQLLSKFDTERRKTKNKKPDFTLVKTEEKIKDTGSALFEEINNFVALHFKLIGNVIKQLERENSSFSANSFGAQITIAFESINRADYSQDEVFNKLADWLKEKTESTDTTICRIVIAYYVRLCNVFKPLNEQMEVADESSE